MLSNKITTIDSVNKIIDFVEYELDLEPMPVMLTDGCSDDVTAFNILQEHKSF